MIHICIIMVVSRLQHTAIQHAYKTHWLLYVIYASTLKALRSAHGVYLCVSWVSHRLLT